MKEQIDQHGYPCEPRRLTELAWFYEQRGGLDVVVQAAAGVAATTVRIPWRKLEAAMDRHRKIKKARKR